MYFYKNNIGCKIGDVFTGSLIYADDIVSLLPRRHVSATIVNKCRKYATSNKYWAKEK